VSIARAGEPQGESSAAEDVGVYTLAWVGYRRWRPVYRRAVQ